LKILGINFGHDASLALFTDGALLSFEELERRTRNKHQLGVSASDIELFLSASGTNFSEIDIVGICSTQGWMMRHCEAIRMTAGWRRRWPSLVPRNLAQWPVDCALKGCDGLASYDRHAVNLHGKTPSVIRSRLRWPYLEGPNVDIGALSPLLKAALGMSDAQKNQYLTSLLAPMTFELRGHEKLSFYVDHHASHAFYAHFYSGARSSVICTHDGGAPILPFNSGGIYLSIDGIGAVPLVSHNLGLGVLYDQISIAVGLDNEPGKLMGLAPYANPSPGAYDLIKHALDAYSSRAWENVVALTDAVIFVSRREQAIRRRSAGQFPFSMKDPELAMQVAANTQLIVQSLFVSVVGRILSEVFEASESFGTVDLTGGFTFNCPTNSLIQQQFSMLKINPLPGAGDTGLPIGAAALLCHVLGVSLKRQIHTSGVIAAFPPPPTAGRSTSPPSIVRRVELGAESTPQFIARAIVEGKILCLFRGRSEVGPRALGNRSIIAHAVNESVRDAINSSKGRELWRPLAPICREEDFRDYFGGDPGLARYMLFTFRVLTSSLPAVTHVDGTARVQCVTASDTWLHAALTLLKAANQIPVIVNTSFNCAGEPLVETFEQAVSSFNRMRFDYLVTDEGVFSRF